MWLSVLLSFDSDDTQNRLVRASSTTATRPCNNATLKAFLVALYTGTYTGTYTVDRLTCGPLGSYTYGASAIGIGVAE